MYVPRAPDQPRVIVLSGPPCSLKSTIAKSVAKELRISHIAVDDIRKWLMREAGQTPEARSRAYDSMHAIAATLLKGHHSVVLDATYTPIIRRREVERLVLEQGGQLYVIQCRVAADEAALRFRNRSANHPGDDLFEERVAYLATRYPYIAKLPIIDTDKPLDASEDERLRLYLREINGVLLGKPVVPGDWSDIPDPGRANTPHTHGSSNKLSPISRFMANVKFWGSISLVCLAAFFAMVGVFPGARLLWQSWWGQAYGKQELRDAFDWAKVWLALAGGFGAIVPLYRLVEPGIKAAYAILAVGKVPRYGPCQDERPSDISLYDEYLIRSSRSDRSRFALEGVPVYLIVPPTSGRRFDVLMEEHRGRIDDTALTIAAANLGLDWKGFCRWRKHELRSEYFYYVDQAGASVSHVRDDGPDVEITVDSCRFDEYACRELSVNLRADDRLPKMRPFFEGDSWNDCTINLDDFNRKRNRYTCFLGVAVLIETSDNYLVLQRRSKDVSQGAGGLNASATGFCNWRNDFQDHWNLRTSLKYAALRELEEELGITELDLRFESPAEKPFIGAALNLLHGRDLNFYAFWRTRLKAEQVSALRCRDRWESASLVFLPSKSLEVDGTFGQPYAGFYSHCNRHLKAALYSLARFSRKE